MTIDRFSDDLKEAYQGFSEPTSERFYQWLAWLGDKLKVELVGLERLPKGPALLVANHAFGWDVAFAMAAIQRETGRVVFGLGEHAWWRFPFLRRLAAAVGTVDGTQDNVDRLLSRGELVLVMPGGLREAMKPRELRYRLLWGHRYGFCRAAIRHGAPLVPLVALGGDEMFDFVGNPFERGRRWLHRPTIPLPRFSRFLPIPRRVSLRFVLGEPIPTDGLEQDETITKRLRREVEGAIHEIIEDELARRQGFSLE